VSKHFLLNHGVGVFYMVLKNEKKKKKKEKWTANIWLVSTAIVIKLLYSK
jgi:hypothetical protein